MKLYISGKGNRPQTISIFSSEIDSDMQSIEISYLHLSQDMAASIQAEANRNMLLNAGNTMQPSSPNNHLKSDKRSFIMINGIAIDEKKSVTAKAIMNRCPCLLFVPLLKPNVQMTEAFPIVPIKNMEA